MKTNIKFYKDLVAVNFLAKDAENGKAVYEAMDGHTAIGVLSKQFETAEEGITYVKEYKKSVPCVSVGLGAGDPAQAIKAATIAAHTDPGHVNQVFTSAGYAAGALATNDCIKTAVNVLISPTGTVGKVKISTGELSSKEMDGIVDVKTALAMLKDMKADAVKFYPMGGLKSIDELKYVAKACADMDISMLEPTGGINLENFEEILRVCVDAGVKKIMPHVYGAVIDKDTGKTDVEKVKTIYGIVKKVIL